MDELFKELDEAKTVIKKLRAEYQTKEELSNSLKKYHNEQLLKFQEAKQLIAEQVQELNGKSDELSEARDMLEGLKSSLHKKELPIRQLNSAKEKLSAIRREKLHKLEGGKQEIKKKCVEAEQKAQAPKELRIRDDVILKLEEDNKSIQDQLKWKTEQFKYLEEAHKRLRE
ncbi:hypothetical protein LWI29_003468 [Acer saccharum]|uniref:Uncharacterized protein n=1 Tax=Acer saccharum TaxID=4024 RepID=A0AA39SEH3_ACESA|nr:hypothetical protein LWI29_003468 [Acer saccharum]